MIKIVAKYNVTVSANGKTVTIQKGDAFNLHGKVFAYKNVLVDFMQVQHAFDIVKEQAIAKPTTYRLIYGIVLPLASGGNIKLAAGTQFSTVADIVAIKGAVLDICKFRNAIEVVTDEAEAKAEPVAYSEGNDSDTGYAETDSETASGTSDEPDKETIELP